MGRGHGAGVFIFPDTPRTDVGSNSYSELMKELRLESEGGGQGGEREGEGEGKGLGQRFADFLFFLKFQPYI